MRNRHCNVAVLQSQRVTLAATVMQRGTSNVAQPAPAEARELLARVLAAPPFASKRRGDLLRYLVERTLAGDAAKLTEYGIALDVFQKPDSFDPRSESTIRAEMSRLRKALAEYYRGVGAWDEWRIEFADRGYVPAFVRAGVAPTSAARPPFRLRRVHWAWLLAALVLAGTAVLLFRFAPAQPVVRSVIVLPFANLTGDPGKEYLADGLTEGLTDALAHVASLHVVARTSAFQFKGKAVDVREIGRLVNADTVVEGSLRQIGDGYRVTVQVNRTADGFHILSKEFDWGLRDLGRIEGELAAPVLAVLRPGMKPPAMRAPDPEAVDLVLRAKALHGYGSQEHFNTAVTLLNRAIQRDPSYAAAWASLATAYAGASTSLSNDPRAAAQQAAAAAARAIALDPGSAEAYAAEGYVDAMVLLNWKRGEQELRSAAALMPQSAVIHQQLGLVLLVQGQFGPALAEASAAEQLDPLVPNAGIPRGLIYFMERHYDEALAQWRKTYALHPDAPRVRQFIGMALEANGDAAAALAEYTANAQRFPADSEFRIIHLLAASGQTDAARRRLAAAVKAYPADPFSVAAIDAALGDRDQAFAMLDQAWNRGDRWALKIHPFLDPLRSDPRYAALLHRSGLEP
jgi:TolB-like protein/Flp pilus assembly protein TadD